MTSPEADLVIYVLMGAFILQGTFKYYLSVRQMKVYKKTKRVPALLGDYMNAETFRKARVYAKDKEEVDNFKDLVLDAVLIPLELHMGMIAVFWQSSMRIGKIIPEYEAVVRYNFFVMCFGIFRNIKKLPFAIFQYIVMNRYGDYGKNFFAREKRRALLISNGMLMLTFAHWRHVHVLYKCALSVLVSFVMVIIYPSFIAPRYDKCTPLQEGTLKKSIMRMAGSLQFPLSDIYVVEESKRRSHSYAYLYGAWNSKRIMLFDTLFKENFNNKEVLALLYHELGHWKLEHVKKEFFIMMANFFLIQYIVTLCYQYPPFFEAFGLDSNVRTNFVNLFIIHSYVLSLYNTIFSFAVNMINRHMEYEADEFAKRMGFRIQLQKALIKINLSNLGFPVNDWLYSYWYHAFPPLLTRLSRLHRLP